MNVLLEAPWELIYQELAISANDEPIELPQIQGNTSAQTELPIVLVVDDEPDIGIIMRRLLCNLFPQIEVIALTEPTTVFQHIHGRVVLFFIADFNMPDINGLQLITKVKAWFPQTKILLMTAYTTVLLECLARQRGVDYYMVKPFNLSDIEHLIGEAISVYESTYAVATS
jgi:DNA-binding NtrC family response regulator